MTNGNELYSCSAALEKLPYNPDYDIDWMGIDIFDIVAAASHDGESW